MATVLVTCGSVDPPPHHASPPRAAAAVPLCPLRVEAGGERAATAPLPCGHGGRLMRLFGPLGGWQSACTPPHDPACCRRWLWGLQGRGVRLEGPHDLPRSHKCARESNQPDLEPAAECGTPARRGGRRHAAVLELQAPSLACTPSKAATIVMAHARNSTWLPPGLWLAKAVVSLRGGGRRVGAGAGEAAVLRPSSGAVPEAAGACAGDLCHTAKRACKFHHLVQVSRGL